MGVKSTYEVPRSVAIDIIYRKLLADVSNSELADMLEAFPESEFRNYDVYNDNVADNGVVYKRYSILNTGQFNPPKTP